MPVVTGSSRSARVKTVSWSGMARTCAFLETSRQLQAAADRCRQTGLRGRDSRARPSLALHDAVFGLRLAVMCLGLQGFPRVPSESQQVVGCRMHVASVL